MNKLTIGKLRGIITLVWKPSVLKNLSSIIRYDLQENHNTKVNSKISSKNSNVGVTLPTYSLAALIFRHIVLGTMTAAALYTRWWLMGSMLPKFQKIDNPASFEENFFIRVSDTCKMLAILVGLGFLRLYIFSPQYLIMSNEHSSFYCEFCDSSKLESNESIFWTYFRLEMSD